jgi:hypothetical protein
MISRVPFLIESNSTIDIAMWLRNQLDEVEARLTQSGALLLRGFGNITENKFRDVVSICCGDALKYVYRSTPRVDLGHNIYTATEYPPGLKIPFHCENAFQREWPLLLLFFCALPAEGGGGLTPLADVEKVTRRISGDIKRKFFDKKVMYIRNYNKDIDLPWQVVFQTESKGAVEVFCREREIDFEWTKNDNLRTRQVCQAFAKNQRTGTTVWFNQAHLFHPSSLDQRTRELLSEMYSEEDFPRNATYGDGSPLSEADLHQIRSAYEAEEVQFEWRKGDILLLDNMRIAHARTPYRGNRRVLAAMGRLSSPGNAAIAREDSVGI